MFDLILESFDVDRLVDTGEFATLLIRLALDLVAASIVIKAIYVRLYRWSEHVFTYFAFNITTFLLCFLLRQVTVGLGFALGLFAIFGILRYRTEPIRIRDLTYLFVVIGLAIMNAMASASVSLVQLLTVNLVIVVSTYMLEYRQRDRRRSTCTVVYDRLELILPGRAEELYADLQGRSGIKAVGFEVKSVDLLRDVATLRVECEVDS